MDIAPQNGDFRIQYYWPSGAKLEIHLYIRKGQNALQVLKKLLQAQGVTLLIIPDIMRIIRDIFLQQRRNPVQNCLQLTSIPKPQKLPEAQHWKNYSSFFQRSSTYTQLRTFQQKLKQKLQIAAQSRKKALIDQEISYASQLSENPPNKVLLKSIHQQNIQKIQTSYLDVQQVLKTELWEYINSQRKKQPSIDDVSTQSTIAGDPNIFSVVFHISLGVQQKRKYQIGLYVSQQICELPVLPLKIQSEEQVSTQLMHPNNVYKLLISCLVLPFITAENIHISSQLIRASESTPQLHFLPLRRQIPEESSLFFTRHSNLPGIEGVFHIPEEEFVLMKEVVVYANLQKVRHLGVPVVEWEDLVLEKEMMSVVKQGLLQCGQGSLETVTFIVEPGQKASVINTIKEVFAESIISII